LGRDGSSAGGFAPDPRFLPLSFRSERIVDSYNAVVVFIDSVVLLSVPIGSILFALIMGLPMIESYSISFILKVRGNALDILSNASLHSPKHEHTQSKQSVDFTLAVRSCLFIARL
jgi:hypothetical protein